MAYRPAKRTEPLRARRIMHVPNTNSGVTPYEPAPPVDLSGIRIQSPEVKWRYHYDRTRPPPGRPLYDEAGGLLGFDG